MKYLELDQEEQEILTAIDADDFEFRSIPKVEAEKSRFGRIATEMLRKTKNINIRLAESDVIKLKAKAMRKGLPYQTLIASILHQYGNR